MLEIKAIISKLMIEIFQLIELLFITIIIIPRKWAHFFLQMQLTKFISNTFWNKRTVKEQMIVCEIQ